MTYCLQGSPWILFLIIAPIKVDSFIKVFPSSDRATVVILGPKGLFALTYIAMYLHVIGLLVWIVYKMIEPIYFNNISYFQKT